MPHALRHVLRLAFVALLAVATAASAGAHRSAVLGDAALAAFLASGGTLSDICNDGERPAHQSVPSCEACQVMGAALLPAPVVVRRAVDARPEPLVFPVVPVSAIPTFGRRAGLTRAPPPSVV